MKKLIIILAVALSLNTIGQENLIFEKRPLKLGEYSLSMAVPLIAFELMEKGEKDKKRHWQAGYITTATVGYFLRKNTDNMAVQILGSLLSGYLVTYAKEYIYDREFGLGTFNKRDINAGCWGANVAAFSYMFTIRHKVKEIKKFN